jgi:hypothetical protein
MLVNGPLAESAEPASDWQPSMAAESWDFLFSPGMPEHPQQVEDGWTFSFPRFEGPLPCRDSLASDCPSVHYLLTRGGGPIIGHYIAMTVEISGSPEFRYKLRANNTCDAPASVRLLIQRKDDDYTKEFHRWWSNPLAIKLEPGRHSINVPLTPDQWSSVLGKKGNAAPREFAAALNDVEYIGMTFGGGCFFGHGVNVSGDEATFTLKAFAVVR